MTLLEEIFSLLNSLPRHEKLQVMQYLVADLVSAEESNIPEQLGWPPNYFVETYGAWHGDPLARPEQGEFVEREPLL